jgi:hypothetical protein
MRYDKPLLQPVRLDVGSATCTPAPRGPGDCDPNEGQIFVGDVNNTPTCLMPPGDLASNVAGTAAWARCVLAGGC